MIFDYEISCKKIMNINTYLNDNVLAKICKKTKKRCVAIYLRKKTNTIKLRRLKNTKLGKRCFIIGNGPSLSIEDLEKIGKEDSFAVNRIYKIFDQTEWRPTFYCSQDTKIWDEIKDDIHIMLEECEGVFLNSYFVKNDRKVKKAENLYYFYVNQEKFFPEYPKFSEDISRQIYEGYTIAYASIQLAVYMGYSEIYIIGTDNNYNLTKKQDGSIEKREGTVNYMKGLEGKQYFLPQLENTTLAFRKASLVCKEKGIIIKNATRGGMLEEFERVDFDKLF